MTDTKNIKHGLMIAWSLVLSPFLVAVIPGRFDVVVVFGILGLLAILISDSFGYRESFLEKDGTLCFLVLYNLVQIAFYLIAMLGLVPIPILLALVIQYFQIALVTVYVARALWQILKNSSSTLPFKICLVCVLPFLTTGLISSFTALDRFSALNTLDYPRSIITGIVSSFLNSVNVYGISPIERILTDLLSFVILIAILYGIISLFATLFKRRSFSV